jgi:hypothetical protein
MLKYLFIICGLFVAVSQSSAQELATGTHRYTDGKTTLTITVPDDIMECSFSITLADGTTDSGKGTFRQAHEEYWYEMYGEKCNYAFSDPYGDVNVIEVEIYDCKKGGKATKVTLRRG